MKRILLSLLVLIFLPACTTTPANLPTVVEPISTVLPTNTPFPTAAPTSTPTRSPSPTPTCQRDAVIKQLRAITDNAEFSMHYNEIQGKKSLVIWLVDPSINPSSSQAEVKDNLKLAYTHAAEWVFQARQAAPCINRLFDALNPIIADRAHNGWFSGEIIPIQVPSASQLNAAVTDEIIKGFAVGYFRQDAPKIQPAAGAAACEWQQAHENIWTHFSKERPNVAFYFTIDDTGANVWAQWDSANQLSDVASILNLAQEVQCLHPAVDQIFVVTVNARGVVQMVGILPKEGIQTLDINTFQVLMQ